MSSRTAPKVIIRGTVFPWSEKAPFTLSGESVLGGLELNEDETQVKCHECGTWKKHLYSHVKLHGLTSRQYRINHGLNLSTSLSCPITKQRRAEWRRGTFAGKTFGRETREKANRARRYTRTELTRGNGRLSEDANLRMNCRAQLTIRITNLARRLGHTPSRKQLEMGDEFGAIGRAAIRWAFHMTVAEAIRAIGLRPNGEGKWNQRIAAPIELAILQARARGLSFRELSQQVGVSEVTARKYVHGNGEAKKPIKPKISDATKQQILRLRADGFTYQAIARELRISIGSAHSKCNG